MIDRTKYLGAIKKAVATWPALPVTEHDLQAFMDEQGAWADQVFAGQTIQAKLEHLKEEIDEIMAAPDDLVEYADAAMLLLNALRCAGYTAAELLGAMRDKLAINRARVWKNNRHVEVERG